MASRQPFSSPARVCKWAVKLRRASADASGSVDRACSIAWASPATSRKPYREAVPLRRCVTTYSSSFEAASTVSPAIPSSMTARVSQASIRKTDRKNSWSVCPSISRSGGQLEARKRRGQLVGDLDEISDGLARLEHRLLRPDGDLRDRLHCRGYPLGPARLLLRRQRDLPGQLGRSLGDTRDLLEAYLGERRQPEARFDLAGPLFHGDDHFPGLLLHGVDETRDRLGGRRGPLRQLPDLVGHDAKPPTSVAGARRLDGGVQREEVRVRFDLLDRVDDGRDLQRAVAKILDLLRDHLHLGPDPL